MKKNDLGEGLPELEVKPPTCVACQYGKQTRLPFPQNKAWRATQKLQLVHTDVGGPQRTPSLNGCGIEHQLTTPYTLKNGVVERKNRTLMKMTRCLLHKKGSQRNFETPTKALQQKTPFEAWYGYKPRLQNLKTFGCLCFSYIPHSNVDILTKPLPKARYEFLRQRLGVCGSKDKEEC
ncbi:hypothetical protein AAG906_000403 [Vitis piasezkii]